MSDDKVKTSLNVFVKIVEGEGRDSNTSRQVLQGISGFDDYESYLPEGVRLFTAADYNLVDGWMKDLANFYDGHTDENKLIDQLVGTENGDKQGYFTKSKLMLMFEHEGQPLGMACLNIKRGGSVKIGPVVVDPNARGKGIGKLLFSTIDSIAQDFKIRKLYATTSHLNDRINAIFQKYGYKIEATYPDQYKKGSNEYIWGKISNGDIADNYEPIILSAGSELISEGEISIHNEVQEADSEYLEQTLQVFRQWHNDLGSDFLQMMLNGYERGKDNLSFQNKSKEIFVAKDDKGKYLGTLTYSPKRGGPVKIYPISGNKEAQAKMIQRSIHLANQHNSHKLYTFAHVEDDKQIEILKEIGFISRGILISPYKNGHNLITFDLFVPN